MKRHAWKCVKHEEKEEYLYFCPECDTCFTKEGKPMVWPLSFEAEIFASYGGQDWNPDCDREKLKQVGKILNK